MPPAGTLGQEIAKSKVDCGTVAPCRQAVHKRSTTCQAGVRLPNLFSNQAGQFAEKHWPLSAIINIEDTRHSPKYHGLARSPEESGAASLN
jgi:hypothetical protein